MNLSPLQLSLVRLLGKKELTFGCLMENEYASHGNPNRFFRFHKKVPFTILGFSLETGKEMSVQDDIHSKTNILGHVPTLSDFHRWMNEHSHEDVPNGWVQHWSSIMITTKDGVPHTITYDSSRDLIDQSEETLKQIETLILSNQ